MKTLYFEGAGWAEADSSKATVGNCRIRTAFSLDNGNRVYCEMSCFEVGKTGYYQGFIDSLFYITDDAPNDDENRHRIKTNGNKVDYTEAGILSFINNLGASFDNIKVLSGLSGYHVFCDNYVRSEADTSRYNYGDEFTPNFDLIRRRHEIEKIVYDWEKGTGVKYPSFSIWVDQSNPDFVRLRFHRPQHHGEYSVKTDLTQSALDNLRNAVQL